MRTYCFPSIIKCIICNVAMRKIITLRNIITYIITIYNMLLHFVSESTLQIPPTPPTPIAAFPGGSCCKKESRSNEKIKNHQHYWICSRRFVDGKPTQENPYRTLFAYKTRSTGSKDKRNNCNYEHSCTCIFTLQSDDYELHANKLC